MEIIAFNAAPGNEKRHEFFSPQIEMTEAVGLSTASVMFAREDLRSGTFPGKGDWLTRPGLAVSSGEIEFQVQPATVYSQLSCQPNLPPISPPSIPVPPEENSNAEESVPA